jgi:hypothetical protein
MERPAATAHTERVKLSLSVIVLTRIEWDIHLSANCRRNSDVTSAASAKVRPVDVWLGLGAWTSGVRRLAPIRGGARWFSTVWPG